MTGLVLSLLGFALVSLVIPEETNGLVRVIPIVGAGLLAVWIGGILLGNVLRPMWRRR